MGDPRAPLLGLLVVLAGLGAMLAGPLSDRGYPPLTAATGCGAGAIALVAGVQAATEVGGVFGMSPDHALAAAAGVACVGGLLSRVPILASAALLLGTVAIGVLVVGMAVATGAPPWTAWTRLAAQPTRAFAASAEWVTEGRTVRRATTLLFTETHRVTALSSGVFRVTEPGATVREWRLGWGDGLTLRAGDRLTLSPGTRVRFEAGKRIPGVAESGAAWAEPRARAEPRALGDALGLAVTLGGGALALVGAPGGASRRGAVLAPFALVVFAFGAASWGVYAAWLTPDLGIGASPLASLAAAPLIAAPPDVGREVVTLIAIGVVALLLATAASLVRRLDALIAPWASSRPAVRAVPALLGVGALGSAVALGWSGVEADPVLRVALGLGASAWAVPRLAGDGRAAGLGTLVGVGAFAALSLAGPLGFENLGAFGVFPALGAAPLAAAVTALVRRRPRRARPAAPVGCPEQGTLPQ